jgi:uracil-DNA glycosylase
VKFDTWAEFLEHQRRQPYMRQISDFVKAERHIAAGPRRVTDPPTGIYPAPEDVFRFTETPLRDVKVVILGQDPYHGPGQADGLAFSTRDDGLLPRSLVNIFRELGDDLGQALFRDLMLKALKEGRDCVRGDLTPWTRQGVLLLNAALTVRRGEAGSHCDIWQPFTDEVIRAVCDSATVAPHFILWGVFAKAALERAITGMIRSPSRPVFRGRIDRRPPSLEGVYTISYLMPRPITCTYSAHPSPRSANLGFFGSRPFSRANLALTLNNPGCAPVDWRLS